MLTYCKCIYVFMYSLCFLILSLINLLYKWPIVCVLCNILFCSFLFFFSSVQFSHLVSIMMWMVRVIARSIIITNRIWSAIFSNTFNVITKMHVFSNLNKHLQMISMIFVTHVDAMISLSIQTFNFQRCAHPQRQLREMENCTLVQWLKGENTIKCIKRIKTD